jgi:hypothetical protein
MPSGPSGGGDRLGATRSAPAVDSQLDHWLAVDQNRPLRWVARWISWCRASVSAAIPVSAIYLRELVLIAASAG